MNNLTETVMARKSVRTFDGKPLSEEHLSDIEKTIEDIPSLFDIPVELKILKADQYGLSTLVTSGEQYYAVGVVPKKPYAGVAFGYAFERLILHATKLGIGTVWIGGTMKREPFEKALDLKDDEMMPCISPLGYPAGKKSLKETLMRKGVGADSRMDPKKLFFKDEWDKVLTPSDDIATILELVRWAPSAVNKQPWRIIEKNGVYHFYEKKDKGFVNEAAGDVQKVDIGIALCHFIMGLEEKGKKAEVSISDPGINIPADAEYIASVSIHN